MCHPLLWPNLPLLSLACACHSSCSARSFLVWHCLIWPNLEQTVVLQSHTSMGCFQIIVSVFFVLLFFNDLLNSSLCTSSTDPLNEPAVSLLISFIHLFLFILVGASVLTLSVWDTLQSTRVHGKQNGSTRLWCQSSRATTSEKFYVPKLFWAGSSKGSF